MRPALIVLAGVAVLAFAGCGGSSDAQSVPHASQRPLRDLSSVGMLKNDFNADRGRTRLLLIFSPT